MSSILQTMREGSGTQHPEEIINFLASRLVSVSGVFDVAGNQFLVEQSDTPAMSVDVRQGYAFIAKSNLQMVYPVWLKTEDAQVAITSNSSGNSRIDSIVLYIDLGASANPTISNVAKLIAVAGTPAGSPTAPDSTAIQAAIGASNPYLVLANVTVASGATTIVNANISDQRVAPTYIFPTASSTTTFTNKRITKRVVSAASYTTSVTIDSDITDIFVITAQAGALLFNNPSGTPTQGQMLAIRIKDNGTARALTWGSDFSGILDTLPSTTTLSKVLYMLFMWNSTTSKWEFIAKTEEG